MNQERNVFRSAVVAKAALRTSGALWHLFPNLVVVRAKNLSLCLFRLLLNDAGGLKAIGLRNVPINHAVTTCNQVKVRGELSRIGRIADFDELCNIMAVCPNRNLGMSRDPFEEFREVGHVNHVTALSIGSEKVAAHMESNELAAFGQKLIEVIRALARTHLMDVRAALFGVASATEKQGAIRGAGALSLRGVTDRTVGGRDSNPELLIASDLDNRVRIRGGRRGLGENRHACHISYRQRSTPFEEN